MPYLQALLSESVKLMFSQYELGMMLQEWFKYIRSNYFIALFLLVIQDFINFNIQDIFPTTP